MARSKNKAPIPKKLIPAALRFKHFQETRSGPDKPYGVLTPPSADELRHERVGLQYERSEEDRAKRRQRSKKKNPQGPRALALDRERKRIAAYVAQRRARGASDSGMSKLVGDWLRVEQKLHANLSDSTVRRALRRWGLLPSKKETQTK